MPSLLRSLALALLIPACTVGDSYGIEDATDVGGGKADAILASTDSSAIVALVNDPLVTVTTLREAGLSMRVATAIIAQRDVATVQTADEIDAIPLVGTTTLTRLAEYAHEVMPADAPRHTAASLTADATWSPTQGPVDLDSVNVPAGTTLTITAGTRIYASKGAGLRISGTLVIKGARGAGVQLIGEGDARIAWDGISALPGATLTADHVSLSDATVGFDIEGATATLRDVTVDGFGYQAILADTSATVDIDGARLTDSSTGQALKATSTASLTARNVIVTNTNVILSNDGTAVIENGTFIDNRSAYSLAVLDSTATTTLRNCIFAGTSFADHAGTFTAENLLLSATTNDDKLASTDQASSANILHGDPLFATANDYHLRPDSPAIDAGTGGPDHDITGRRRENMPDLGAYELVR